jgi:hypothetical protein
MRARLRLAVLLAAVAVLLQPNAVPRQVVELTNRAHGAIASHDVVSSSETPEARLVATSRDEPTDGVLHRARFLAVAVAITAIAVATRRRTLRTVAGVLPAVPWCASRWVRGPPFAA